MKKREALRALPRWVFALALLAALAWWGFASGSWQAAWAAWSQATATTHPSDASQTSSDALATLATLEVKGKGAKTGYSREQFGPAWADVDHNGCDTRNDILARDLSEVTFKANTHECVVLSGHLADPYTGSGIDFVRGVKTSAAVQIDHVVALGNVWISGGAAMSDDERLAIANDPLNLLAVDGPTNGSKGDSNAAEWLPKYGRCDYARRQVKVKAKYHLSITEPERQALERVLTAC